MRLVCLYAWLWFQCVFRRLTYDGPGHGSLWRRKESYRCCLENREDLPEITVVGEGCLPKSIDVFRDFFLVGLCRPEKRNFLTKLKIVGHNRITDCRKSNKNPCRGRYPRFKFRRRIGSLLAWHVSILGPQLQKGSSNANF